MPTKYFRTSQEERAAEEARIQLALQDAQRKREHHQQAAERLAQQVGSVINEVLGDFATAKNLSTPRRIGAVQWTIDYWNWGNVRISYGLAAAAGPSGISVVHSHHARADVEVGEQSRRGVTLGTGRACQALAALDITDRVQCSGRNPVGALLFIRRI